MKTETQIAEKNIKLKYSVSRNFWLVKCLEHKTSCERSLGFLKKHERDDYRGCGFVLQVREKITDLKRAIKLYEGVGI